MSSACISKPSASEATAAAMLSASINYPLRGAVTWKSTVGTNVASDALANLASSGVKGGALIILGEDYGEGASIMQERTHAFAMKSQMWLLDPRPQLPAIMRGGTGLRAVGGQQYAGHADAAHSCLPRLRPLQDEKQPQTRVLGCRCSGGTHAGLQPHHSAALDVCAGDGKDSRVRLPAACDSLRSAGLNEFIDGRRERHRHRHAGRPVQQHACARSNCSIAPIPSATAGFRCTCSTSPIRSYRKSG